MTGEKHMSETLSLETRITRLESRALIAELSAHYAMACDERDMEKLERLFTHDAVFDTPNGSMRAEGRGQIMRMFERVLAIRGPGFHWTHDHIVRFDQGREDQASGVVFCHAETTPDGVQSIAALRYDDIYRMEEGDWRIARRTISFLYYVPVEDYARALTRADRVRLGERRVQADLPEALPSWRAFAASQSKTQAE
jgi:ketosteroid isomerase-like protein